MPKTRKGNFWLLVGVSTLCALFPISLGIYASRLKVRWLWILFSASIVTIVVLFVGFGTSPTVPDPDASSGTRTEPNALASVAILGYVGLWVAALVVQFVKRAAYEASYLREGKTLDLSTIRARHSSETSVDSSVSTQTATDSRSKRSISNANSGSRSSVENQTPSRGLPINMMSADQLQTLGISKAVVIAVIARRDALGGFSSAAQVQSSVEMQPHEWVKIRSLVASESDEELPATESAGPDDRPDMGPRPGGRILDV